MRVRLRVTGQVQGVGFRPWVARTARALGLSGAVRNGADGVWIDAQGEAVPALLAALAEAPSPIDARVVEQIELAPREAQGFHIEASTQGADRVPTLPPDLATCPGCLSEVADPNDWRHGYLLLSCTACGPRYSIAGAPPFDRETTAMRAFPLCEHCAREYEDPEDRRYHAQATACAGCGPRLSIGIDDAAAVVREGGLLAVKGLSGFQILCDARDQGAVERVRAVKRRPDRPLAVMVRDPSEVAGPSAAELDALSGADAPIVVCQADLGLAPSVTRGVPSVGLMRPSTAVHAALLEALDGPVVCTSANVSGEPLAATADQVPSVDAVLDHARPIWRAADDSVVQLLSGRPQVLRRARGHAPRPVPLGRSGPPLLAMGADLKSAIALALGDQAVLSPFLGRLGSRRMVERLQAEVRSLCEVYAVRPEAVLCDAHPDFVSRHVGEALATEWGVPVRPIGHHHAHVAAVCAERRLEGPVLAFAFDGVGLGSDGGIWGGEVLRVDGLDLERVAHLRPFALPGGDRCALEPARTALALLHAAGLPSRELHPRSAEIGALLDSGSGAGRRTCTAMGRLFDGIAALIGVGPDRVTWEAQLPVALEGLARRHGPAPGYRLAENPLDWRPWVHGILDDLDGGVAPERIAARFHGTVLDALAAVVEQEAPDDIVLCGGCFANRVLAEGALERLGRHRVWIGRAVPCGDGGIALGQAWLGRRMGG